MTHVASPLEHGQFKDRSTGLVVFGVIALLVGALAGCVAMITPMTLSMQNVAPPAPGAPPPDARSILIGGVTYALIAGVFITLGIGSIRGRRWVRPAMLSVAWTWLLFGIMTGAMWLLIWPDMAEIVAAADPSAPPMPAGVANLIVVVAGVFLFVTQIALPAAFVLFYRSPHVQATLADRDPRPAWTDQCPVPVLTLSVGLAAGAVGFLLMLPYGVAPAFGTLLIGGAAVAMLVAAAGVMLWMAWATFKLQPIGWWGTVALFIALAAAVVPTFARITPAEMYLAMGMPPEQVEAYRGMTSTPINFIVLAITLIGVVYMLRIRRFFAAPPR